MNFVADEGIDRQIVERLRQVGHDVLSIAELAPGTFDDEILDRANAQQALLVTADKDFGELVFRLRRIHAGVVVLRLAGLAPETKAGLVPGWWRHCHRGRATRQVAPTATSAAFHPQAV